MIPVITPAESARLDAEAAEPVGVLMERAGLGVALAAVRLGARPGHPVVVLAGPGNNGGDGYAAARHLARRGVPVRVEALSEPRTEAAMAAAEEARRAGVRVSGIGPPAASVLVVDALFGGGFRRGLPDAVRPWLESDLPVLAVDVPTGLDPGDGTVEDGAFRAVETVTFHALKTGHLLGEGPDRCGRVRVVDIGLTGGAAALRVVEDEDAPRPDRPRRAHKWSAGSVLVVGGAPGMVGAAILAARSALRFGAGAVGLAVPGASSTVVATAAPEVLSSPLEEVDRQLERFDVLLVGPGLGAEGDLVERLLQRHVGTVVLDADGINEVGRETLAARRPPTIITPHAGEFRRLAGEEAGVERARSLSGALGVVTLLKGNPTFVTDGGVPWVVTSNGPELATIGTGDVLAGMVAALVARGVEPLAAARSAAHWHGRAGAELFLAGTVTADALATHVGRFAWCRP